MNGVAFRGNAKDRVAESFVKASERKSSALRHDITFFTSAQPLRYFFVISDSPSEAFDLAYGSEELHVKSTPRYTREGEQRRSEKHDASRLRRWYRISPQGCHLAAARGQIKEKS
jgi:hypothetical protein